MNNILHKTKFGLYLGLGLLACILSSKAVSAQYYSQNEVGQEIVVDKKIRPINDSTFYDNIDPNKKVFFNEEQLEFKITVLNSGKESLYNVELKDFLPKYLTLLYYPGVFNKTDNNFVTSIDKLDPGQSKDFFVRAYVNNVPTSTVVNNRILQVNKVTVTNGNVSDSDQSQYYISTNMVPVTGSNDIGIKTMIILITTITSFGLRKIARGY